MSESSVPDQPSRPTGGLVAVLSLDRIFALDIQQAFEGEGYSTQYFSVFDQNSRSSIDFSRVVGGVIDVHRRDHRSRAAVDWFAEHGLPTIVITSFESDVFLEMPNVLACYSKPMTVDVLPSVFGSSGVYFSDEIPLTQYGF